MAVILKVNAIAEAIFCRRRERAKRGVMPETFRTEQRKFKEQCPEIV
jgi:hypothetical protein